MHTFVDWRFLQSKFGEIIEEQRKNIPFIYIYTLIPTYSYLQVYWRDCAQRRRVYTLLRLKTHIEPPCVPTRCGPDTPEGVSLERGQTISVADIREI